MDKRKNNGGHSTKAKGVDKRKNPYRNAIHEAISKDQVIDVLKAMYDKAIEKKDVKAAQLLLSYTVGKPVDNINLNSDNDFNVSILEFIKGSDSR